MIHALRHALLTAALALFVQATAHAQAAPNAQRAERDAAFAAADKAATRGPSDVKLADQATLKLPKGYAYVPPAEGGRVLTAMGNRPGEGLLGLVFPESDDNWILVMRFAKTGYIKDDDARDWKTDELLKGLKEGTEESNKERKQRGIPEIEVTGWVEPPAYDATTHRLVWSLASKGKGEPDSAERGINYNTYALGREGYISMNLVTGMRSIGKYKPVAHQMLGALEYESGKRYTDFNSATDHVAEFGLAALVGGGLIAKKLGLFALIAAFFVKFAKLIGIAAVAVIALLFKLFGRKKTPTPGA